MKLNDSDLIASSTEELNGGLIIASVFLYFPALLWHALITVKLWS